MIDHVSSVQFLGTPADGCACCLLPVEPGTPAFRAHHPAGMQSAMFHRDCALGVHVSEVDGHLYGCYTPRDHSCPVSVYGSAHGALTPTVPTQLPAA